MYIMHVVLYWRWVSKHRRMIKKLKVTSHVFIGYFVRKTILIVVLQIVINNDFYCRNSYRLLKRHRNTTLGAISRRDIIT
jgi:hypothetical protein